MIYHAVMAYIFSGLPLYIGKSINIRSRIMDHFRNTDEASLLMTDYQANFYTDIAV